VPLAFALVYLAWSTTFLAIRVGVHYFPPGLFGGIRVGLAGLLILGYLAWRGESLRLSRPELLWASLIGLVLFLGGNFLITAGEQYVASSVAAVLAATSPLFMALIELAWPWGERPSVRGWLGLLAGFGGVLLMFTPRLLREPELLLHDAGPPLVLGSAFFWALGSFLLKRQRQRGPHLASAAYQMVVGGTGQVVLGLALGEAGKVTADSFAWQAVYSFLHLLLFGSLVGFVAYTWLLGHVSTTQAGTYAYVTPILAIVVGGLLGDEKITGWIVGGMALILAGVALIRTQAPLRRNPKVSAGIS